MEFENDLIFKLRTFKKYASDINRYKSNAEIRNLYLKKESKECLKDIIKLMENKDCDRERFYYIYWELADILYGMKRYDEACRYYKRAIDNVISPSYKKNRLKLKSKHYKLFLDRYYFAIDSFLKAGRFNEANYYDELNMYLENITKLDKRYMGDLYASLGAKEPAIKYYEKVIDEIDSIAITRQYDYDPYTDDYLKEEYDRKIAEKEKKKRDYIDKINSL